EEFLGSRGVLMGIGLTLRSGDEFKIDLDYSAIPDSGQDRGPVRVPESDREHWRTWARARARRTFSPSEWIDLAFSNQRDPGVQAEFYERYYYNYEQKDNYLHWRKALGPYYFDSSLKVRLEDRTDTEELPSAGVFRERAEVGHVGNLPLLWTGWLDAD